MPAASIRLNMNISGLNYSASQSKFMDINKINEPLLPKAPSSLNSPMVSRIFNARPGCGSCGK